MKTPSGELSMSRRLIKRLGFSNGTKGAMMSEAEKRESRRSLVRVLVTYGAAGFLFVIGSAMILALLYQGSYAEAKDLFLTILPVSAAIVSYWFAGRSVGKPNPGADDTGKHEQPPNDSDRPQH